MRFSFSPYQLWYPVYTNIMASLQRRFVRGHAYYYLVESRRVNGRPRPVILQYLGSANTLWQRLQQASAPPLRARVRHWGGVAALYDLAQQLQLIELIDEVVPKRKQGPSLGQYLLIAAINRCLAPARLVTLHTPARLVRLVRATVLFSALLGQHGTAQPREDRGD